MVDEHAASVVIIDTSPIGTVDFNLSQLEKEFLLKVGRASALKFLKGRTLDDGLLTPWCELQSRKRRNAEKK